MFISNDYKWDESLIQGFLKVVTYSWTQKQNTVYKLNIKFQGRGKILTL